MTDYKNMTDKEFAAYESAIHKEWKDEESARMAEAMKAVDLVSKWSPQTSMTYGICKRK